MITAVQLVWFGVGRAANGCHEYCPYFRASNHVCQQEDCSPWYWAWSAAKTEDSRQYSSLNVGYVQPDTLPEHRIEAAPSGYYSSQAQTAICYFSAPSWDLSEPHLDFSEPLLQESLYPALTPSVWLHKNNVMLQPSRINCFHTFKSYVECTSRLAGNTFPITTKWILLPCGSLIRCSP